MFGSISIADPNTIVTSSFTAVENCQIGVEAGSTVRVNGQVVSARPINLVVNDKIELDVFSSGPDAHKFVNWTYNGVQSWFAVVSSAGSAKPRLKSMYRGKNWLDFKPTGATPFVYLSPDGSETQIVGGAAASPQTSDLAVTVDTYNGVLNFYRGSDGARFYQLSSGGHPLSHAAVWNGAANSWESHVLDDRGYITRYDASRKATVSTVAYPKATTMFTDGSTLYLGGNGYLVVLSDINTIARTYTTTENIQAGVALADLAIVTTASGGAYKLNSTSLELVYQASMIGTPAVFQNYFVLPITEQYKLRILNYLGQFIGEIDTGDLLPWAVNTWRDSRMAVACVDSKSVLIYSDIVTAPTVRTFSNKVTFAVPCDTGVFASYYLNSFQLTIPPNPTVQGLNFKDWTAPIGVKTGTGEYTMITEGEGLLCDVSPNATLLVNGDSTLRTANAGSTIQLCQTAYEGQARAAVVVGNYAFDFKVKAAKSSAFATSINTGTKTKASQLVWTFNVPNKVVAAPIALSKGTLQVDGVTYNGSSPVYAGQRLTITINVPAGLTSYSSVLSIADAQYPLIMNVAANRTADTQKFQPYSSNDTVSTFAVEEDGVYNFPEYKDAYVTIADQPLSFPATLAQGDILTVHHIQTSSWWLDERDTVIMGPSLNYFAKSFTTVKDMPENVDFGTVHMGIPDFAFPGDKEAVIEGLSEDYKITIFANYMYFSVNGGPYLAQPQVGNGDKVTALYTVQNLFDKQAAKTILADGSTVYEFGYLSIDPALGQNYYQEEDIKPAAVGLWDYSWNHVETPDANDPELQQIPAKDGVASQPQYQQEKAPPGAASVGVRFQASSPPGKASVGMWFQASSPPGKSSVGNWFQASSPPGKASIGNWQNGTPQRGMNTSVPSFFTPSVSGTKTSAPLHPRVGTSVFYRTPGLHQDEQSSIRLASTASQVREAAFGIPATYIRFTPTFHHESSFFPRLVTSYYVFQGTRSERIANTAWRVMSGRVPRYWNGIPKFFTGTILRIANTQYVNMQDRLVRDTKITSQFNTGAISRSKPQISSWINGTLLRSWNQQSSWLASVSRSNTIVPQFSTSVVRTNSISGFVPAPSFVAKNHLSAIKPVVFTSVAKKQDARAVSDTNWETFLPFQTGGYVDTESAQEAATAYNNALPVTVYQQPEGSFSFVYKRNTELVCQIKGTNLFAVKWLIGGG